MCLLTLCLGFKPASRLTQARNVSNHMKSQHNSTLACARTREHAHACRHNACACVHVLMRMHACECEAENCCARKFSCQQAGRNEFPFTTLQPHMHTHTHTFTRALCVRESMCACSHVRACACAYTNYYMLMHARDVRVMCMQCVCARACACKLNLLQKKVEVNDEMFRGSISPLYALQLRFVSLHASRRK